MSPQTLTALQESVIHTSSPYLRWLQATPDSIYFRGKGTYWGRGKEGFLVSATSIDAEIYCLLRQLFYPNALVGTHAGSQALDTSLIPYEWNLGYSSKNPLICWRLLRFFRAQIQGISWVITTKHSNFVPLLINWLTKTNKEALNLAFVPSISSRRVQKIPKARGLNRNKYIPAHPSSPKVYSNQDTQLCWMPFSHLRPTACI